MDLNDIIRSFLGFRGPPGMNDEFSEDGGHFSFFGLPRHPGGAAEDDDDDDDDNGPFGGRRGGYRHLDEFFNFDKESEAMFRQFEDMFRTFGSSDFHSESAGIPSLDEIPNRNPKSPRDEMLKSPNELHKNEPIHSNKPSHNDRLPSGSDLQNDEDRHAPVIKFGEVFRTPWHWNIPALPSTTDKQDKDIDDQVEDGRLEDILKPRQHQQPPNMRSFSKSVSIQTIRKPDGTTETKRTEQDSDGNVTTTVTTSQDGGDQETQIMTPSRSCKEPWSRHGWGGQHGWPRHKWSRCKPPCADDEQRQSLSDKLFGPWFR